MTGGAFTSEARDFLAATPNPCVEKPLDMERLFSLLEGRAAPGASGAQHEGA